MANGYRLEPNQIYFDDMNYVNLIQFKAVRSICACHKRSQLDHKLPTSLRNQWLAGVFFLVACQRQGRKSWHGND